MDNQKRRVLVTGASGALGASIARDLAKTGFSLTLHYHSNIKKIEELQAELLKEDIKTDRISFDVSKRDEVKELIEEDITKNGAYYGIVLNAGIYKDAPFPGLSEEDWDSVLNTNLGSFYNVLHPLIMPMIQLRKGGRIVVMSSLSGITGNRGQTNYSATKAGLIGASKSLSQELAKRKITVNCVAPGFIASEMTDNLDLKEYIKTIPLQRAGKPEEVSSLVEYLFTDKASYITGQVISVNGGII